MAIQLSKEQKQEGWSMVKFGQVAREVKLTTKDPASAGYEFYLGLEHLDPQSLRIVRKGVIAEDNPTFTRCFTAGNILFGKRRSYQKKAAVADFDGICSGDIIVMEAMPKGPIIPKLLPFIVQSDGFFAWAEKNSMGSLSPRTKWSALAEYEFPLPPLERQQRILEVLQKIEECDNQKKEAYKAATQFCTCLSNKIFSKEYAESKHWKKSKITMVVSYLNGKSFPSSDYQKEGIRLLKHGNIEANGTVSWSEKMSTFLPIRYWEENLRYQLFEGDIVMSLTAQSLEDGFLGRVCRVQKNDRCLLNQRIAKIIPTSIEPSFLFWALKGPTVRTHISLAVQGTKVKNLNNKDIETISIFYPDNIAEQENIGNIFDKIEIFIHLLQNNINHFTIAKQKFLKEFFLNNVEND